MFNKGQRFSLKLELNLREFMLKLGTSRKHINKSNSYKKF